MVSESVNGPRPGNAAQSSANKLTFSNLFYLLVVLHPTEASAHTRQSRVYAVVLRIVQTMSKVCVDRRLRRDSAPQAVKTVFLEGTVVDLWVSSSERQPSALLAT